MVDERQKSTHMLKRGNNLIITHTIKETTKTKTLHMAEGPINIQAVFMLL